MKKNTPFQGYLGRESDYWKNHHSRYKDSILAVGRGNASPNVNLKEYADARRQFDDMVRRDFPGDRSKLAALDLGFGQGHYAKACHELGFGRYLGIDFAAPTPAWSRPGYEFKRGDVSDRLGRGKFDLVYCIDVIFHVVDDAKFEQALSNIAESARGYIYVTSLFRPYVAKPYVKHRGVEAFERHFGKVLTISPWRDNRIARFKVVGDQ